MSSPSKPKRDAVPRALSIVNRLLKGETVTYEDIQQAVGVQKNRAREFAALIAEGLDGASIGDRPGSVEKVLRLDGYRVASVSWLDVVAANMAASLGSVLVGSSVASSMRNLARLAAILSKDAKRHDHAERKFVFLARGGEARAVDGENDLIRILRALVEEHPITANYTNFRGETKRVELRPLSLIFYEHQLYVMADEGDASRPKTYRFSRFRDVNVSDVPFEYPLRSEFDPSVIFRNAFGVFAHLEQQPERVVLVLDPKWATYANSHRWHLSQRCSSLSDGRTSVELTVVVDPELERWILGFGDEIEVVAPASLREKISETLRNASLRYQPSSDATHLDARLDPSSNAG